MLDQQIESASSKLVQFIQDLTINFQTIFNNNFNINFNQHFIELFQLRSDYAKQLASLFDMLINRVIEEFLPNRIIQLKINIDPVQMWRSIQNSIDQLNDLQRQDLHSIIKHIRTINNYFYNLLLQVKNAEFLKVDQTRAMYQNLTEELYCLSESLLHFTSIFFINTEKINTIKSSDYSKPVDTYLFQNVSTTTQSTNNNNNHVNEITTNTSSNKKSSMSSPMNSNCNQCNMINNQIPQQPYWNGTGRGFCFQPNPVHCATGSVPITNVFAHQKPMSCSNTSQKNDVPPPLCFPTPVVYTPEMETLSSSGGIIYARKSGNTWIAENLGTLIETLKDIGQTIDMNAHCEILVRKTGELLVRRKRGRRKRFLQQTISKTTARGNNAYAEMNANQEQSDSNNSNDDQ
ncbi:unnamed protein product [Adineta steineri]|uniref:Uncharacterized protein n=1 Tax=Adineta steineri TaxID=433720 RepID=A0A814ZXK6_9BILA|nr:unnamed protein product [Adineta steineri]CAF1251433.1 unnamed protein product [Adineta steineri]